MCMYSVAVVLKKIFAFSEGHHFPSVLFLQSKNPQISVKGDVKRIFLACRLITIACIYIKNGFKENKNFVVSFK